MKYKVLYVALVVAALLVVTDARKTTSNRNRGGSSGTRSRGKVNHPPSAPPAPSSGGFSQPRSPSGYGFSQPKPAPKAQEHRPVGWQVNNKETAVRKDVAGTQHATYPAASNGLSGSGTVQGSHAYPASGGLSGNSPTNQQIPVQQSHTYPSNSQPGQNSGANNLHALSYPPNNQQSHTYPNSGGLSGHPNSAPPGYQSQPGGAAHGYPGQHSTNQGVPPAYPGQQGIHQSGPPGYPGGTAANNHPSGYPGQVGAAHPVGHANYPQQAPVYPGYSGVGSGGVGGGYGGGGYSSPGGFGGYNGYGVGSRGSSGLTGLGIAGVSVGTVLTGLTLWNLARTTSRGSHHTQQINVHNTYNTYNETHTGPGASSPAVPNAPVIDPVLGELVNCTLTVSATNASNIIAIDCLLATSVVSAKDDKLTQDPGTETKCIVTVVNKNGTEFTKPISCPALMRLAEEAQPPQPFPQPNSNCTLPAGLTPDPINPCMPLEGDVTVIPLPSTPKGSTSSTAPITAPAA